MKLEDLNLKFFSKLVAISVLIVYFLVSFLNRTDVYSIITQALSPLLYAFTITYFLDYFVRLLEKYKLPKWLSILITISLFIFIIIIAGVLIFPRIIDAVNAVVISLGQVDFDFEQLFSYDFENQYFNEIKDSLYNTISPMVDKITNLTGSFISLFITEIQKITSKVFNFIIAFVIAIYMLIEKKDLIARLKRIIYAFFKKDKADFMVTVSNKAHLIFKDFVIGKLLDSLIMGILSFIVFNIFGFEYVILIALIFGVTNMIPYFGPFLGAIPIAIIAFVASPGNPIMVLWALIIILILQQLDGWVIGPFILGDSTGVSAFWIITAVTIGGASFGVLGMFLGVPAVVLLKTILEENVEKNLLAKGYPDLEKSNLKIKNKKTNNSASKGRKNE